jgi:hypothetical protein
MPVPLFKGIFILHRSAYDDIYGTVKRDAFVRQR